MWPSPLFHDNPAGTARERMEANPFGQIDRAFAAFTQEVLATDERRGDVRECGTHLMTRARPRQTVLNPRSGDPFITPVDALVPPV
ncbi:MAG TPA: hypothetical protein VF221_20565 [Chloroflexota bacterium]